jgi:hypothetical protein
MDPTDLRHGPRLALDAASMGLGFAAILAFPGRNLLVLGLVCAIGAARLSLTRDRRDWLAFVAGATAGAANDAFQVACGVYTYARPDLWVLPCFMLPLWGVIFVLLRGLFAAVDQSAAMRWPRARTDEKLGLDVLLFAEATAAVCLLYGEPFLAAALCVAADGMWLIRDRRRGDLTIAALAAVFGPLSEAVLVHGGTYAFAAPTVFSLPAWHPFYWIACALFLRRLRGWLEA